MQFNILVGPANFFVLLNIEQGNPGAASRGFLG